MSKLVLSKENAAKIISTWKIQVQNYLQSQALPKKFFGVRTITTSATTTVTTSKHSATANFHEVDSLYDFIAKHIPVPETAAYTDSDTFRGDLQKYKQCVAKVKVEMKEFLSDALYEIFVSEEHCDEGMNSVLLEVKYDEASQLKVLQRELELITQINSQTVKQYADSVNSLILQLQALGLRVSDHDFQ